MAVDVRDEGVDKRCRLRRIGAVATVRDALERATLLQADVNIVDLAGIVCDIVNVLGKFRSTYCCWVFVKDSQLSEPRMTQSPRRSRKPRQNW